MGIKKVFLIILIAILHHSAYSQHENDVWITGYSANNDTFDYPDTGTVKILGNSFLDFRSNPIKISRTQKGLCFYQLNVSICDSVGDLLLYSNGYKLFNKYHKLIEGGDSLGNSSGFLELSKKGYYGCSKYGTGICSMLILPRTNYPYQFYIFNFHMNSDTWRIKGEYRFYNFYYTLVDMKANNGYGKVVVREKEIFKGDFNPTIAASKHANGKDWWVVITDRQNVDSFKNIHKILVTSDIIKEIVSKDTLFKPVLSLGSNFSTDGKHYVIATLDGLMLYEFDRCTGELFNGKIATYYDYSDTSNPNEPFFSPNGKYIYISVGNALCQYDVFNNFESSSIIVAKSDYKQDSLTLGYSSFGSLQYTPDRKKIIISSWVTRFMHTIDSPDNRGVSCHVKLNAISLPTVGTAIPHFPNYTLGADSCYASSILESSNYELLIYPNPANDKVVIKFNKNHYPAANVCITDMLGRVVYHQERRMMMDKLEIETQNWASGLYFVQVYNSYNSLIQIVKLNVNKEN